MKLLLLTSIMLMMFGCSMRDTVGPEIDDNISGNGNPSDSTGGTIIDSSGGVVDTSGGVIDTTDGGIVIDTSGSGDKGVVIVSERTERIHFEGSKEAVTTIVGMDTISLKDIRDEIDKEDMSLLLFAVTNLSIRGTAINNPAANLYKDIPMVLKISTVLPGESPELSVVTPDSSNFFPVSSVGKLHNGLELNNGLYAKKGALKSFESKVKDSSLDKIIFRVEIDFHAPVTLPEEFSLDFTIEGTSKKAI